MDYLVDKYNKNCPAVPVNIECDFMLSPDVSLETVLRLDEIFDKLYAYEQLGLEPMEIKRKLAKLESQSMFQPYSCLKCKRTLLLKKK